jgi:hypothetical protein
MICGVLRESNRGAELDGFTLRGQVSPRQDGRADAKTVVSLCCGIDVPTIADKPRAHYTSCPLLRAERERQWAQRDELRDRAHREAVLPSRQNPERIRAALDELKATSDAATRPRGHRQHQP